MRTTCLCLSLALICPGCLKYERQVTSPGAKGIVVDAQTHAPLSGARVVVSRATPYFATNVLTVEEALTNTRPPVVTTGNDGRFRIRPEQHHEWIVDYLIQPYRPRDGTLIVQLVGYQPVAIPLCGGLTPMGSPPPASLITVPLSPISE
jgi:hypothetical protein